MVKKRRGTLNVDYKENRADRVANLNRLFENDEGVGILIACADFEWTVNRVVLA